jgi:type IV secretory pathway VirB4 component
MSLFSNILGAKKTPQKDASTFVAHDVTIKEGKDTTKESVRPQKTYHSDDSTQRYLPFAEIRDNIIMMKDGSARIVLKVEAVNFLLKSEQEQDAIVYSFQHFLNALQFPIQILIRSLKVDIEGYLNRLKTITAGQKNPLLRDQAERYIEFLTNLVNVAQIMKKEFYVIIPHDEVENQSVAPRGMFQIVKSFFSGVSQTVLSDEVRKRLARVGYLKKRCYEKANMIKSSLGFVGLKSEILSKDQLIELMISYYDPKVNSVAKVLDKEAHYDLGG